MMFVCQLLTFEQIIWAATYVLIFALCVLIPFTVPKSDVVLLSAMMEPVFLGITLCASFTLRETIQVRIPNKNTIRLQNASFLIRCSAIRNISS